MLLAKESSEINGKTGQKLYQTQEQTMETRFSFIFRIMGGTADGENNQDWTAERTTGKIPCNLCGYLYLWWSSGRRQDFRVALEPIRHMNNKNYNAVIFRSNYTQVTSPGGLWDSSGKIYSLVKGLIH